MNTKEASKKWNCSVETVRNYCASGIIPQAEKMGKTWNIPVGCKKPPMTRHGLCFLLDTIYQLNNGVSYEAVSWGYSMSEVRKGFDYLISNAFMTSIDVNRLNKELKNASVTDRGKNLIERENSENKNRPNYKAYVSTEANFGIAKVGLGGEISNKN